jgi:hypothetical protein
MHVKYTFSLERRGHRLLLAPFFAVGAPTGMREQYSVRLAGQPVTKQSSGPATASLMPGLAAGWRHGIWAAVVSVGSEAWLTLRDTYYDPRHPPVGETRPKQPGVALHAAYQLSVTLVRDVGLSLALHQVHELVARADGGDDDRLYAVPGIRLQPYRGFFGHVGVAFRLSRIKRESQSAMITLQAGWEFR